MKDKLNLEAINDLPHPLSAKFIGCNIVWPIHDIEVQCALCRIDVVGKLQVKQYSDISVLIDGEGVEHDPDIFWNEE